MRSNKFLAWCIAFTNILPVWLLRGFLLDGPLYLLGRVLIPWQANKLRYRMERSRIWPDVTILRWKSSLMNACFGNEQDGIDGLPFNRPSSNSNWQAVPFKTIEARIIAWSAKRNPTNNLRFWRWLSPATILPEKTRWVGPVSAEEYTHLLGKVGITIAWQGLAAGIKVTFKRRGQTIRLWVGYKINPLDVTNPGWWPADPRWRGIGYTLGQLKRA